MTLKLFEFKREKPACFEFEKNRKDALAGCIKPDQEDLPAAQQVWVVSSYPTMIHKMLSWSKASTFSFALFGTALHIQLTRIVLNEHCVPIQQPRVAHRDHE